MPMMKDPPHPGVSVRENYVDGYCLTVTEAPSRLGVTRVALSRVLNGHAAISPEMAIRREKVGWCTAGFWIRRQAYYDLAQARSRADRIPVGADQPPPTDRLRPGVRESLGDAEQGRQRPPSHAV